MEMTAQWSDGYGTAPGLRDALRSLIVSAGGERDLWRLGDTEITDSLSDIAQVRALLEIAEVSLVREGLERGLPSESAWSAHDWVTRAEGRRACDRRRGTSRPSSGWPGPGHGWRDGLR